MTTPLPSARLLDGALLLPSRGSDLVVRPWPVLTVAELFRGMLTSALEEPEIDVRLARHEAVAILPSIEPLGKRGRNSEQLMLLPAAPTVVGGAVFEHATAWRTFLGAIPLEILDQVARFPLPHLGLLRAAAAHPEIADLMRSTPALAWVLAHGEAFSAEATPLEPGEVQRLLAGRQRAMAEQLGFGGTEAVIRILRKLPYASLGAHSLTALRRLLADPTAARRLAHLPRVNLGLIAMLDDPCVSRMATDRLAAEVAERREEDSEPRTTILLQDIRRMAGLLGRPVQQLLSIREATETHAELVYQVNRLPPGRLGWRRARPGGIGAPPPPEPPPGVFPPPPLPAAPDGSVVPITTSKALAREGRVMGHCAWSYEGLVLVGSSYIYRVMKPERATLELRMDRGEWRIWQVQGRGNSPVADRTIEAVRRWAASARLATSPAWRRPGVTA